MVILNPGNWSSVVSERMSVIVGHGPGKQIRISCFPPAKINRTSPEPFDPSEQRLAPKHDLAASAREMDQALCRAFHKAVKRSVVAKDETERLQILKDTYPSLKKAVFSYAGHSGPAYASGAFAMIKWRRRLSRLLLKETLWVDKDYWPRTLISYNPELIPVLRNLPEARAENLVALRRDFKRYQHMAKQASGHSGTALMTWVPTTEELLLAELGDRLRTVLTYSPKLPASREPLIYKRYKFNLSHPQRSDYRRQVLGPFQVQFPSRF